MSSNSIRVGAEIFNTAREEGELMSRSAAQQIEHWARMGAALEACGLTVDEVAFLLKSAPEAVAPQRPPPRGGTGKVAKPHLPMTQTERQPEPGDATLWAFKRQRQRADLENARSGRVTQDRLSWFSGGKARNLKLIDSPY